MAVSSAKRREDLEATLNALDDEGLVAIGEAYKRFAGISDDETAADARAKMVDEAKN